ncbi:MAG: hypothetical protein AAFR12_22595 [Cyanobacteria bacterium J06626_6]
MFIWIQHDGTEIMNNVSIEEIEKKIEAGEEVIDRYFDPETTRVGTPRPMTARRGKG